MSKYISYVYYGKSPEYDNYLGIHNGVDGAEVYSGLYKLGSYTSDGNGIAVDQEGNTYITGFYADKIIKLDDEGNLLLEVDVDTPCQIAVAPNGSLYTYDRSGTSCNRTVRKRSSQTLEVLDETDVGIHDGDFWGMAFDSDGYLYMVDHDNDRLEKWNVATKSRVTTLDLSYLPGYFWAFQVSIAIVGTKVLIVSWASAYHFYETTTSLININPYNNTDLLPHEDDESLLLTSLDDTYFIYIAAINAGEDQTLYKLNADLSVVWQVPINKMELGLGAYTYAMMIVEPPIIWDPYWPELPMVFPDLTLPDMNFNIGLDLYLKRLYTEKDVEDLRQKCINYEKNYTNLCLVVNHNTTVIKNWFQESYGGEVNIENEKFFEIYPSQQLATLHVDPLELNDFKGIINRFMNVDSSNARNLNHNFDLYTEWLHDYNPTEDGYKASYVRPTEETITNNEPTVNYLKNKVDRLSQEIFGGTIAMKHNFDLIKEITQGV